MRNQKKTLERFFFQWHIVAKTTDKQWKAVDIDLKMSHTAVFSESQITTKYFIKMTKKAINATVFSFQDCNTNILISWNIRQSL